MVACVLFVCFAGWVLHARNVLITRATVFKRCEGDFRGVEAGRRPLRGEAMEPQVEQGFQDPQGLFVRPSFAPANPRFGVPRATRYGDR